LTSETGGMEAKIGRDGAPMVLIPAGKFQMGSNDGADREKPTHTVYLDAFYMDKYEVTNAQYRKFMEATGHSAPKHWDDANYNAPEQPVVGVCWHDAMAYAKWAGKRLPTEAEWEKAARGLTGKAGKLTRDDANYDGIGGRDRWEYTAPVGSFAPNSFGLCDMAGNVLEWCADWFDDNYYSASPGQNPKGPGSGKHRVLRGGSWLSTINYLRSTNRFHFNPMAPFNSFGFRCAE
jgi:iron(II)-dependent oxidoreductase